MSADLVRRWLADGALDLPLPGSGATAHRWGRLAELAECDIVAGRLAEAHADAAAILADLGGPRRNPISCGVCGPPNPPMRCCAPEAAVTS